MPGFRSFLRNRFNRLFRRFGLVPRPNLSILSLEERVVPAVLVDPRLLNSLQPAIARLTADSVPDMAVANPNGTLTALDGASGATLFTRQPFGPQYGGPLTVAATDINHDGRAEIAVSTGFGAGPRVQVLDGATQTVLYDRFVYDVRFNGGVSVALGDVTGDGFVDLVTAAGYRGGPHIKIFDGATSFSTSRSFFAYDTVYRGGVNVAVGDLDGDGTAEIVTGTGPGGGAHVRVFDGRTLQATHAFFTTDPANLNGTRVGVGDVDGNGLADIVTHSAGRLRAYAGRNTTPFHDVPTFNIAAISLPTGNNVTGEDLDGDGFGESFLADSFNVQTYNGDPIAATSFIYTPGNNPGVFAKAPGSKAPNAFTGEAFFVPGTGNGTIGLTRLRSFTTAGSTLGVFAVDNAAGKLGSLNPGDPGYIDAATAASKFLLNSSGAAANTITVEAGRFYGLILTSGGNTSVSFRNANPGQSSQFRILPGNRIAVEDSALAAGDRDFNDLIGDLAVNGVTNPPPPPPPGGGNISETITTVITGGDSGTTKVTNNVLRLSEGNSFRVAAEIPFTVPAASTQVQVTFTAPSFDTASVGNIRDAFEVAVLGKDGQPLALPTAAERDASFNVSEGLTAISAPGTTTTATTVSVNLSSLPAGTEAKLVLRLVNNDTDDGTFVDVSRVDFLPTASAAPTGVTPTIEPGSAGKVNFETLNDVTPSLRADYGRTTLTDERTVLTTDVSIRNLGVYNIGGRLIVAVGNLSDPAVNVLEADGVTPDGRPYFDFTNYLTSGVLNPGDSTARRTLRFSNPNRERFTFELEALAGLNRAPVFTSSPPTAVEAGNKLSYSAMAEDADEQALTFTLVGGPEAMTINPAGLLSWSPAVADVGSHSVRIRVTDTLGASAEQAFNVQVQADLPNRPPVFTSTPVTEAKVAGAFEVTTIAAGASPVGIAAAGTSIITANAGDANLSIDSQPASLGEQASTLLFRGPTEIPLGFLAFDNPSDHNQMHGFAQADINRDGHLDFITSGRTRTVVTGVSDTYRNFVGVSLGDGDGNFEVVNTFTAPGPNSNEDYFSNLYVADVTGDGKLDLIGNSYHAYNNHIPLVVVLPGNDDGTFSAAITSPLSHGGNYYGSLDFADLNGDSKLDIITRDASGERAGTHFGNGDGTFAAYTEFYNRVGTGDATYYGFATGDLDGKNGPDIVVPDWQDQTLHVYLNDGAGGFPAKTTLAAEMPFSHPAYGNTNPQTTWIADFTGDSIMDILYVASYASDINNAGGLGLYKGTGDGVNFTFVESATGLRARMSNASVERAPVDLNRDGKLDIIVGADRNISGYAVGVALNNGDGTFATSLYSIPLAGRDHTGGGEYDHVSVFAGDYNSDGLIDIAAATSVNNFSDRFNGAVILFADQPGVFNAPTQQASVNPYNIIQIAGDVNNDGNQDLIIGAGDRWYTRIGHGDGTFDAAFPATPALYANDPHYGELVDLNHDGILDLVWSRTHAYQGANGGLCAALGNGDGTFTLTMNAVGPPGSFYGATMIPTADYNNDGYADIASYFGSAFAIGTVIDVYLYDAANPNAGVFLPSYRYVYPGDANGNNNSAISQTLNRGDFDGDGNVDLIAVPWRQGPYNHRINFFKGKGDGTFFEPTSADIFLTNTDGRVIQPHATDVGDINNDGKLDLAVLSSYSHQAIFLGNGDGTFKTPIQYGESQAFGPDRAMRLVDIDGDGNLDMATKSYRSGRRGVAIRVGIGDGHFGPTEHYFNAGGDGIFEFADFDNDGAKEMFVGGSGSFYHTEFFTNNAPLLTDTVAADFNNDGRIDSLSTTNANGRVKVLLANADGVFIRQPDLLVGKGAAALAATDLDGDGDVDIATANRTARSITTIINGVRTDIPVGKLLSDVAIGEFTGDGVNDVIAVSAADKTLFLIDDGIALPFALGDTPGQIIVKDMTADGRDDVILSLPESKRLMILPGDGDAGFETPIYVTLNTPAGGLGAADFNADGKMDLALTLPGSDQTAVLFGRGNGRFANPQTITVGDNPASLSIADRNADGRPDILVANKGDDTASIILNLYDPTKLYRYTPTATDPDGDTVTFDLASAPGGMLMGDDGKILWAPNADQIGLNSVSIIARDGNGGAATQSFNIDVQPNRENAAPVIFSTAPDTLDAGKAYSYSPTAVDPNGDVLRYRLLNGPASAAIDPVTGEVTWDPRQEAMRLNHDTAAASVIDIPHSNSMAAPSFTVEGFFRFDSSRNNQILFNKVRYVPFANQHSFRLWYLNGQLHATISGDDGAGNIGEFVFGANWNPSVGQWHHLAMTFDDTSGIITLIADGQVVGSAASGRHVVYDGNPLQIGYEYGNPFLGSVGQFRMWNVAKTPEEIRTGLGAEIAADAPNLIMDHRFSDGDAESVFDHSINRNDGRRLNNGTSHPWPVPIAGLAFEQTQYFTIQVEDGRGGVRTQSFGVNVVPSVKGSLTGTVFSDDDGNGVRNGTEAGLKGSVVYIDANDNSVLDAGEASTVSGADGSYTLAGLYAGRVKVGVETEAGRTGLYQDITIPAGTAATADFAQTPLPGGSIRGTVTLDTNANGLANELLGLYTSDFGSASPNLASWTGGTITASPSGTKFLGEYTNDTISLALAAIPGHSELHVSFDLYILKSWDGVNGPDQWKFSVDGKPLVDATFSNTGAQQSFPQVIGSANNAPRTGVVSSNTLGYTFWGDTTYHFDFTIPHSAATATLTFQGINIQAFTDESWGLNNVVVTAPEPRVTGWPVYLDANGNSVRDDGEIATVTDQSGDYLFYNQSDGTHAVRLDNAAGWTTTAPPSGVRNVALTGSATGVDFGLVASDEATARPRFLTTLRDYATARVDYRFANAARDPGSRPLTYALAAAPEGMSIDPASGVVVWTPTLDQVGPQTVVLRVSNDRGGVVLQTTVINVGAPNSDPVITSIAPNAANVDVPVVYEVLAQDAEETTLQYDLTSAPAGAVIGADGRITWTPAAGQLGVQQFTVEVTDGQGGVARQSFAITVTPGGANIDPNFTGDVRTVASANLPYFAELTATDADGDPLTFALVTGPASMTISNGMLAWTPTAAQFGANNVRVSVSDGRGGLAVRDFTIDVRSTLANSGPAITSTPRNFAVAGKLYTYDIVANDLDNDPIAYELVSGPSGLSLDPMRGTVRWTPAADQFGQHDVTLRALDPFGGVAEQSFTISVRAVGGPPAITSVPPVQAGVGSAYLYSVIAADAENDPLTFTLLESPAGMNLNAVTGELQWTPTAADIGSKQVVIQVSDGSGGFATQAFAIEVAAGLANRPPVITSLPPLTASADSIYSTTLLATDPEGTTVTFEKRRGPVNMTVSSDGIVTWTPTAADIGTVIIAFAALDSAGGVAVQSFELEVLSANIAPVIASFFPVSVPARGTYKYDVVATDANLDPLTYELSSAPASMTVDAFGRVRWATAIADLGPKSATLTVRDPRGGVAVQTLNFNVVPDTQAPRVTVIPINTIVRSNSPETFAKFNLTPSYPTNMVRVSAVDNVAVTGIAVTANGKPVGLNAQGYATFRFEDWGFGGITVVAKASDAANNVGVGTKAFAFLPYGDDPAVSQFEPPSVVITSPTENGSTLGVVQIHGSATSENFTSWTLSVRPGNGISTGNVIAGDFDIPGDYTNVQFTQLAAGTNKISDGLLGTWDTTLLENGDYVLRLEEQDDVYGTTVFETTVGVRGDFKLGNFRLSFNDMTIPVAGIPITLARTYDSLRADRDGDLGHGWRLEFRNTDLRTSLPRTGLEDVGIYSAFKPGTKVYLTLPGGTREGFTFAPEIRVLPGFGGPGLAIATPRFTPDRGVRSTLSVGGGSLIINEAGELSTLGGIPWNPANPDFGGGYTLTTRDGVRYRIDGNTGLLTSATDRNDNVLVFSDAGITGQGVNVIFERDAQGRITKATDPAGNSVLYGYDSRGDLVRVTDREGNVSRFEYRTDKPHYLEKVIDPLGRTGVRAEYDADGRIVATVDANGVSLPVVYDPDNSIVQTFDALGKAVVTEYDARGNVVASTDALGRTTRTTYNDDNQMISRMNPAGETTQFGYDALGFENKRTDALGHTRSWSYDAAGGMLSSVDALGNSQTFVRDARGNLLTATDQLGNMTAYEYDDRGLNTRKTDPDGFSTAFAYDSAGRALSTTLPDGSTASVNRDPLGNPTSSTTLQTTSTGVRTLTVFASFDKNGRATSYTDAEGKTTTRVYSATGQIAHETDALGRTMSYEYDAAGNNTATVLPNGARIEKTLDDNGQTTETTVPGGTTYEYDYNAAGFPTGYTQPDGAQQTVTYDAVGRPLVSVDPSGVSTSRIYDDNSQLISTTSAGTTRTNQFDAAGRVTASVDGLNRAVLSTYDAAGRLVTMTLPNGGVYSYGYDARGNRTRVTDPLNQTTLYRYDSRSRLTEVRDAAGFSTNYTYDEPGNLVSQTDANGRTTRYEYNGRGQMTSMTTALGRVSSFEYDAAGRLTSRTNGAGETISYTYTSLDQIATKTLPGNVVTAYQYRSSGQVASITDHRGVTTYQYDSANRIARIIEPDGRATDYVYNSAGQLLSRTTPAGQTAYTPDAAGRLGTVTDSDGGLITYTYDAEGQVVSVARPDGTLETRTYDALGNATRVLTTRGGATVSDLVYQYDLLGRQTRFTEAGQAETVFAYDTLNRLVSETRTPSAGTATATTYVYDAVGNRISLTDAAGTTVFTFDADNQLTATSGADAANYTYDLAGRRILRDAGLLDRSTYTWNAENRLTGITTVTPLSTQTTQYVYNAFGTMVSRTDSGVETRFLTSYSTDLPVVLEEYTPAGAVIASYTYGLEVESRKNGGTRTWYHADADGNVLYRTNAAGVVVGENRYTAFGSPTQSTGESQPYTFDGERYDSGTGLTYLRARHYDPAAGVFLSPDPIMGDPREPVTRHKYLYANNAPTNGSDPTGLLTLGEVLTNQYIHAILYTSGTQLALGVVLAGITGINIWNGPTYTASVGEAFAGLADYTTLGVKDRTIVRSRLVEFYFGATASPPRLSDYYKTENLNRSSATVSGNLGLAASYLLGVFNILNFNFTVSGNELYTAGAFGTGGAAPGAVTGAYVGGGLNIGIGPTGALVTKLLGFSPFTSFGSQISLEGFSVAQSLINTQVELQAAIGFSVNVGFCFGILFEDNLPDDRPPES